jgi:hypothetical protein
MVLFDFNREPEISWFHDGEEDIWIIDYFPFRLVRIHSRVPSVAFPPQHRSSQQPNCLQNPPADAGIENPKVYRT